MFASHVGATERLLETSIAYARTRNQFGQLIGKFQAVSHRIADMKVQLEAARLLTYRAAWRLEHARSASLDAAMTKLFVSESLVQAALGTVQIHGGYGYMRSTRSSGPCAMPWAAPSTRAPVRCSETSSRAGWGFKAWAERARCR